jgi:putative addiction module CopG family antidote
MQITIELPEHLFAYIQAQVTSGQYATPSEYIEALIRADQARKTHAETFPTYRQAGSLKGLITQTPDFEAPLQDLEDYM